MIAARCSDALRVCSHRATSRCRSETSLGNQRTTNSATTRHTNSLQRAAKSVAFGKHGGSVCWGVFQESVKCRQQRNDLFTSTIVVTEASPRSVDHYWGRACHRHQRNQANCNRSHHCRHRIQTRTRQHGHRLPSTFRSPEY